MKFTTTRVRVPILTVQVLLPVALQHIIGLRELDFRYAYLPLLHKHIGLGRLDVTDCLSFIIMSSISKNTMAHIFVLYFSVHDLDLNEIVQPQPSSLAVGARSRVSMEGHRTCVLLALGNPRTYAGVTHLLCVSPDKSLPMQSLTGSNVVGVFMVFSVRLCRNV